MPSKRDLSMMDEKELQTYNNILESNLPNDIRTTLAYVYFQSVRTVEYLATDRISKKIEYVFKSAKK